MPKIVKKIDFISSERPENQRSYQQKMCGKRGLVLGAKIKLVIYLPDH